MSAPKRRNGALVTQIERSCIQKVRYQDPITARAAGQYYGDFFKRQMYMYRCKFCGGWHLTKKRFSNRWNMADAMDEL